MDTSIKVEILTILFTCIIHIFINLVYIVGSYVFERKMESKGFLAIAYLCMGISTFSSFAQAAHYADQQNFGATMMYVQLAVSSIAISIIAYRCSKKDEIIVNKYKRKEE